MASIGHRLAGDAVYGPRTVLRFLNGQCLHAKELGCVHPITGEKLCFNSELPTYFQDYLMRLRKEHRRLNGTCMTIWFFAIWTTHC